MAPVYDFCRNTQKSQNTQYTRYAKYTVHTNCAGLWPPTGAPPSKREMGWRRDSEPAFWPGIPNPTTSKHARHARTRAHTHCSQRSPFKGNRRPLQYKNTGKSRFATPDTHLLLKITQIKRRIAPKTGSEAC